MKKKTNTAQTLWTKEAKKAREKNKRAKAFEDLAEYAWGIIANAGGSDWRKESKMWQGAARKWREQYFTLLGNVPLKTFSPAKKIKKDVLSSLTKE